MKKITDPEFRYTPAVSTDIRKTFARVRREMARSAAATKAADAKMHEVSRIVPIPKRK